MPSFRSALLALDGTGVPHCVRNAGERVDELPAGDDLDVLVSRKHLRTAGRALEQAGFHRLRAPGHRGHRFFLAVDDAGVWRKIDVLTMLRYGDLVLLVEPVIARRRLVDGVWAAGEQDEQAHRSRREAGLREPRSLRRSVAQRRPAGLRRRGPVVAVLGPDGAGKGSTLAGAAAALPVGVTRVYLGNTRPPRATLAQAAGRAPTTDGAPHAGLPSSLRESAFLLRKALPLWRRLATAYAASWRGHVVLCDRHPVEVLAIQPERTKVGASLERLLLTRLVPTPDRVVVLDAPGDVLFARKGEHDPVTLERWRQAYLATFVPPGVVVRTTGTVEQSVQDVLAVLWTALGERNGWPDLPPARVPGT